MEFSELSVQEFEKFALGAPGANFMQSREMYERFLKNGREAYLVGVKSSAGKSAEAGATSGSRGKVLAAGILMNMGSKRGLGKIFGIAMGPLMDFSAENWREVLAVFTSGMREFLKPKTAFAVQITPHAAVSRRDYENQPLCEVFPEIKPELKKLGYKDLGEVGQIKWEYVIDFGKGKARKSLEEIFDGFRKDIRTRIKQASERYGVRIRDLEFDELSVMKDMTDEAVAAHNFHDKDLKYYQEMWEAFGDKVKFVVAEVPKEIAEGKVERLDKMPEGSQLSGEYVPISAVMYMLYGPEVISLFSGVTRKYKNVGGCSHLIRWELIKYAYENGFSRYDFYGVKPVAGNSVYNFKAGFRGEIEELVGTHQLPITALGKAYTLRAKYKEYGVF